jgi:hypothetical protein
MHRYRTWNSAMPTTAAQASVTTGTAIKTMLQIATPATRQLQLIAWGFTIDSAPGDSSVFELLQTDVAATVTAHSASGVQPLDPNAPASLVTLGTAATGFTSSSEGTPTGVRVFDVVAANSSLTLTAAVATYRYQWMPDERPTIGVSKFLRVRATTPTTAVNLRCFVVWDE